MGLLLGHRVRGSEAGWEGATLGTGLRASEEPSAQKSKTMGQSGFSWPGKDHMTPRGLRDLDQPTPPFWVSRSLSVNWRVVDWMVL